MSKENVEIVRAGFESFGSPEVFEFLDPDVEWKVRPDLPDADIYRGRDGVRQLYRRFEEVMDDIWFRPDEFIPVGSEQVVVPLRWGGTGKTSGVDFEESRETWVFTIRGGKIVRVQEFATREGALEAAGLRQ
jgi:ketosteroid isomerase-like protein